MSFLTALLALPGVGTALAVIGAGIAGVVALLRFRSVSRQDGANEQRAAELQTTTEAYQDAAKVRRDVGALPPGGAAERLQRDFGRDGR